MVAGANNEKDGTFFNISNLSPGCTYNITFLKLTFVVCNISRHTKLQAVSNVKVHAVTTRDLSVSWTAPQGCYDGFNMTINSSKVIPLKNVTSYIVNELQPGVTYSIEIITVQGENASNPSASQHGTTKPNAVGHVKVEKDLTNLTLSWSLNDFNANTYNYKLISSDANVSRIINSTTATSGEVVDNLRPGTNYKFILTTLTADNTSSTEYSFNATTKPNAVGHVKVEKDLTNLTLSWSLNDLNANTYNYKLISSDANVSRIINSTTATSGEVVDNLRPGTNYKFILTTLTADNTSSTEYSFNATTMPNAVGHVKVEKDLTNLTLSWSLNDLNANTYNYKLISSDANVSRIINSTTATSGEVVDNLRPGTNYKFILTTLTADNTSSTEYSFNATTKPNAVGHVKVEKDLTNLTLSWSLNDLNANTYNYKLISSDANVSRIINSTTATSGEVVDNLRPGTNYKFILTTLTADNTSSTEYSFNATTKPNAVGHVKVEKDLTNLTLSWSLNDLNANTYNYKLISSDANVSRIINSTTATSGEVVDNLRPGTNYKFILTTLTADNTSSTEYSFNATTMPSAVCSVNVSHRSTDILQLEWTNDDDNAKQYHYELSFGKSQEVQADKQTKKRNTTVQGLKPGNNYVFFLTTFTVDNVASINCSFNETTRPTAPLNVSGTTETSRIILNWTKPLMDNNVKEYIFIVKLLQENATKVKMVYIDPVKTNGTSMVIANLTQGELCNVSVQSDFQGIGSEPQLLSLRTVPDKIGEVTCIPGPYQLVFEWDKPHGRYSSFNISSGGTIMDTSETLSYKLMKLSPLTRYQVTIYTVSSEILSEPRYAQCTTTHDSGVVAGSVIGVLCLIILCVLTVYLWKWRREEKGVSRPLTTLGHCNKPIPVSNFVQYFAEKHADSDYGFAQEYSSLSPIGTDQPMIKAMLTENKTKNRYINILPYDHSRVILKPLDNDPNTDYINANYMPSYHSDSEFIACQGPLPDTVNDFWRMVLEHHIEVVVMLTNCMETGKVKCEHYWPLDYTPCTYGDITVTITSETILPEWTVRHFTIKQENDSQTHTVRHFHFTAWPDHGVPDNTSGVIQFRHLVRNFLNESPKKGPTVVHCSAGVGRTGTLIALDYLLQQMEKEKVVSVYDIVYKMRMNRPSMVQTESQYIFLNQCLYDIINPEIHENIYENQQELIYENMKTEAIYENSLGTNKEEKTAETYVA
ncbi:receptor-type tyrosine-protein phosphatase H [Protopterus annectens]|uniref:receptor-type tyrosine-protein phosphatase H n=1 Tax=Protopterus annectens TaxID=7888 RepID=UPI001CF9D4B4|nr:receptor-type tyrosine-protein phosphatase H [Protopterus annectens]